MLKLEDRLRTRFQWGLVADIIPPDYETRMAIIKNKADSLGLELPDDVCAYIAENITTNVRQIEGTVKKIMAYRELSRHDRGRPVGLPGHQGHVQGQDRGAPHPQSHHFRGQPLLFHPESTLRGTLKNKGTAEARQVAMYLIRQLTNLSLPDIGREFGKDHSTVIYAIRKVEQGLAGNAGGMQESIRDITANINNRL